MRLNDVSPCKSIFAKIVSDSAYMQNAYLGKMSAFACKQNAFLGKMSAFACKQNAYLEKMRHFASMAKPLNWEKKVLCQHSKTTKSGKEGTLPA